MSKVKKIDLITTSRADFTIAKELYKLIKECKYFSIRIIFTGSHYDAESIENLNDYRELIACEETTLISAEGIGNSLEESGFALGSITKGFTNLWASSPPNIVILIGDRFELLPIATVAILFGIPIAHMFGGEVDISYCLDTQIRDALTKMSHLHFVSHEVVAKRIGNMGEEAWRIAVMGNPSIGRCDDQSNAFKDYAVEKKWPTSKIIAACYLPPTIERELYKTELNAIVASLHNWSDYTVIWAGVNTDPGSSEIRNFLKSHSKKYQNHIFIEGLGPTLYHGLLQTAEVLIGNSSSGLLEAATFGLPVVNVGVRQTGRLSGGNVLNVPAVVGDINHALRKALKGRVFRATAKNVINPFAPKGKIDIVLIKIKKALEMDKKMLMIKRSTRGNPKFVGGLRRVPEY